MKPAFEKSVSRVVLARAVLFAVVWWALSDGSAQSWWVGAPAVALAVIASVALLAPVPLVWWQLLKFVPVFLWRSLQGGADVAWRALDPRLPIAPEMIDYPLRLPSGLPQVMLINIMSLLPGTLSAELEGQVLKIHVLDGRGDVLPELEALERSVARISGVTLAPAKRGE
jgi:multicomponent Na+:H+ antiporter subunit E